MIAPRYRWRFPQAPLSHPGLDAAARERGKNLVKEFVSQVLEGAMTVSKDAEVMINARIAQIDHLVSLQLNEVLHNAIFQKLEVSNRTEAVVKGIEMGLISPEEPN